VDFNSRRKQWGIEQYNDFLITGTAKPTFATGFDWYSQGIICAQVASVRL